MKGLIRFICSNWKKIEVEFHPWHSTLEKRWVSLNFKVYQDLQNFI